MKSLFTLVFVFTISLTAFSQGFSTQATTWSLPDGGSVNNQGTEFGFNVMSGGSFGDEDSHTWSTVDMNGDGKADLVITGQGDGDYTFGFGLGSNPHWKVYLSNGSGFDSSPISWSLPDGGATNNIGVFFGYYELSGNSSGADGDHVWMTTDVDGDGRPDLVLTGEGDGDYIYGFGLGNNPHWKVYLNNGSGFASTATSWTLPSGGAVNTLGEAFGFYEFNGNSSGAENDLAWSTVDINGDSKPDLVVTGMGDGDYVSSFGIGSYPHWKVYMNNGSGFSTSSTNWWTPSGGEFNSLGTNFGFYEINGIGGDAENDRSWSLFDITGDGMLDLVVTAEGDGDNSTSFDTGNDPHWRVFQNYGEGFQSASTAWDLPAGGILSGSGFEFGFTKLSYNGYSTDGTNSWHTADMNNDGRPDLVVMGEGDGDYNYGFSVGNNPHWKVYHSNGWGFSTSSTSYGLPGGGAINNSGVEFGFNRWAGSYSSSDGALLWTTTDINGDNKPDLVISGEGDGTYMTSYDLDNNHHWKVYLNNTPTDIQESNAGIQELTAYPNPSTGVVTIEFDGSADKSNVTCYNNEGKIVHSELQVTMGHNHILDLSMQPAGIYQLIVTQAEQVYHVRLVIE